MKLYATPSGMNDAPLHEPNCTNDDQEPITRRSIQLSIIPAEHVRSNVSNLTMPLFGTFLRNKRQPSRCWLVHFGVTTVQIPTWSTIIPDLFS